MKRQFIKIIVLLTVLLGLIGCGQPRVPTQELVYTQIIEHNLNADKAYELSKMWLVETFNDSKAVIEYTNKDNHIIMGKGIFKNIYYAPSYVNTKFTIKIETKDNKTKITLNNIILLYNQKFIKSAPMTGVDDFKEFKNRAKKLILEYHKFIDNTNISKSDW